jgi:hypothetical protein
MHSRVVSRNLNLSRNNLNPNLSQLKKNRRNVDHRVVDHLDAEALHHEDLLASVNPQWMMYQ